MAASIRSLRALDWLNVFLADVRYGIGPFLAIYLLRDLKWDPADIGFAMSIPGITAIVFQSPAGGLVDNSRRKRMFVITACLLIACCCIGMASTKKPALIILIQFIMGITITIYTPAITAISLGLVGNSKFPARMGRNHTFNHAGNVVITLIAGAIGYFFNFNYIFFLLALMCLLSAATVLIIQEKEINHIVAREAHVTENKTEISSLKSVLTDRKIIFFILSVVIFYFSNGAMLPLLGQILARGNEEFSTLYMAGGVIVAELVMVPVAALTGYAASKGNRKYLFTIAFIILPVRAICYTQTKDPYYLLAIQIFDGLAAGITGVISVVMIADLTRGTGRFNFMQGAMVTAIEIGEAMSHYTTGFIVSSYSYNTGFIFLASVAVFGLIFFNLFVPETKRL
jgi:MFS family permease